MDSRSLSPPAAGDFAPLDLLRPGSSAVVQVMVCRRWDVSNSFGKYRGTEFVLSDVQGNAIQCSTRSNIAHCFVSKLIEGELYTISRFTVAHNKKKFRVRRADDFVMELEGYSIVTKIECSRDGFERYPFQLVPLTELEVNDSVYLVDVVGCVVDVGKIRTIPSGAEVLDIYLVNEIGTRVRVSLWGSLCGDFLKRPGLVRSPYIVVLPSLNVKYHSGEIYLSSTSGTSVYDDCHISPIDSLRRVLSPNGPLDRLLQPVTAPSRTVTVDTLVRIGREHKEERRQTMLVRCKANIVSIRAKDSWFYYSCGSGGCKKRVDTVGTGFWCNTCKKSWQYPKPSYRIQLNVEDETGVVVLTLFDEVSVQLLKKKADVYLGSSTAGEMAEPIPHDIKSFVGQVFIFEVKTHSFFDGKDYVSFTVSQIIAVERHEEGVKVVQKRERDGLGGSSEHGNTKKQSVAENVDDTSSTDGSNEQEEC